MKLPHNLLSSLVEKSQQDLYKAESDLGVNVIRKPNPLQGRGLASDETQGESIRPPGQPQEYPFAKELHGKYFQNPTTQEPQQNFNEQDPEITGDVKDYGELGQLNIEGEKPKPELDFDYFIKKGEEFLQKAAGVQPDTEETLAAKKIYGKLEQQRKKMEDADLEAQLAKVQELVSDSTMIDRIKLSATALYKKDLELMDEALTPARRRGYLEGSSVGESLFNMATFAITGGASDAYGVPISTIMEKHIEQDFQKRIKEKEEIMKVYDSVEKRLNNRRQAMNDYVDQNLKIVTARLNYFSAQVKSTQQQLKLKDTLSKLKEKLSERDRKIAKEYKDSAKVIATREKDIMSDQAKEAKRSADKEKYIFENEGKNYRAAMAVIGRAQANKELDKQRLKRKEIDAETSKYGADKKAETSIYGVDKRADTAKKRLSLDYNRLSQKDRNDVEKLRADWGRIDISKFNATERKRHNKITEKLNNRKFWLDGIQEVGKNVRWGIEEARRAKELNEKIKQEYFKKEPNPLAQTLKLQQIAKNREAKRIQKEDSTITLNKGWSGLWKKRGIKEDQVLIAKSPEKAKALKKDGGSIKDFQKNASNSLKVLRFLDGAKGLKGVVPLAKGYIGANSEWEDVKGIITEMKTRLRIKITGGGNISEAEHKFLTAVSSFDLSTPQKLLLGTNTQKMERIFKEYVNETRTNITDTLKDNDGRQNILDVVNYYGKKVGAN